MLDVLSRYTDKHLHKEPFPYIVIPNALPEPEVQALLNEISRVESHIDLSRPQGRYALVKEDICKVKDVPNFQAFFELHSSPAFKEKVFEIFDPFLKQHLPKLPTNACEKSTSSMAFVKNVPPKREEYSPRRAHLDNLNDVFAFLYYLRPETSDIKGGNLQLFKYKDRFRGFDRGQKTDTQFLPMKDIEVLSEVPYENNTLVLFLDGIHSIHGVTPLEMGSSSSRYYFTGGAQYPEKCYNPLDYLDPIEKTKDYFGHIMQKARMRIQGSDSYLK